MDNFSGFFLCRESAQGAHLSNIFIRNETMRKKKVMYYGKVNR